MIIKNMEYQWGNRIEVVALYEDNAVGYNLVLVELSEDGSESEIKRENGFRMEKHDQPFVLTPEEISQLRPQLLMLDNLNNVQL